MHSRQDIPFKNPASAGITQSSRRKKTPTGSPMGVFSNNKPDDNLLSHWLQHYHRRRVVSRSCSGWEGVGPTYYGHKALTCVQCCRQSGSIANLGEVKFSFGVAQLIIRVNAYNLQGYRDKPYGQLVSVSLMHYCTSTPDLSTSWSRTTLQRAQGSGKSHLKASFPLRCFQRLSLPDLATRQCHWRDNRYTRGLSTPVLSY